MEVNIFDSEVFLTFLKFGILIILVFYVIFALMVIRQVDLMGKTLITNVSPIIKGISILHASFALVLVILAWIIL